MPFCWVLGKVASAPVQGPGGLAVQLVCRDVLLWEIGALRRSLVESASAPDAGRAPAEETLKLLKRLVKQARALTEQLRTGQSTHEIVIRE